jgi:molecular chaperone DnaK (HSP70)
VRLGIDFGTTRTLVSAAMNGRYPIAAFDCGGEYRDWLPGLAVHTEQGLHLGWEAQDALNQPNLGALRSVKRAITGTAPDDLVQGLPNLAVSSLELTTRYLMFLRSMLVNHSNFELSPDEPLEAMIAVPANSNTRQRYLTMEAFTRAGFKVLGMVNEPTAAAIEFAHRNLSALATRSPKRYVVVYDLGGGTFDSSAVSLVDRRFNLLSSEGIGKLGGNDFDEIILEQALATAGVSPTDIPPAIRTALLEVCREAKEGLSANSRRLLIDLSVHLKEVEPVVLDTSAVYEQCKPLIEKSIDLLNDVFAKLVDYGIDPQNPRELGAIYLVGGAVSFPPVARALRAVFKRKIQLAPQPHAATAIGLAISADLDAGIFVREAITRHFGVWREGESGKEKVFDPIFGKDAATDDQGVLQVQRSYRPTHRVGHLRYLECTSLNSEGQPAGDLTPWEELVFPYDPQMVGKSDLSDLSWERLSQPLAEEIVETYTYRNNGTIEVCIANRSSGYQQDLVLGAVR